MQTFAKTRSQLTKRRVRQGMSGSATRPRLVVRISLHHVNVQLIDDQAHTTLQSVTTKGQKTMDKKSMTEKAQWAGDEIAKKAKSAKIDTIVFDRGGRRYHGRVKALAEAARNGGLKF